MPVGYLQGHGHAGFGADFGQGGSTTTHGPHTYEHGSLVYVLEVVTVVYVPGHALP